MNSTYSKMMERVNATSSIQKAIESLTTNSAYSQMMEQANATSSIQKAIESLTTNSAYSQMMEQESATSSIQKVIDSLTTNSVCSQMMEQANATGSTLKAMESLATSRAYSKTIAVLSTSTSFQSVFDSISNTESFRTAIMSLAIPANLEASIVAVAHETASVHGQEQNIAEQIANLAKAKEHSDFLRLFTKIPTHIQVIMLFITLQILLPIINNVTANIITPHIESLIEDSRKPRRELVKAIASSSMQDIDLSQHRFVSVDVLHLREQPSTKSKIIDDLQLGQVLTVVSRERNWVEVTYVQDNEMMQGWVFARYAAKFKP